MEFGKLENIQNVDWSLPSIGADSLEYLHSLPREASKTELFIGTPAWARPEWLGTIYPEKTKSADFLTYYAQNFSCIELNTVHYRIPTESQVKSWREKVSPSFRFCPKVFQGISHSLQGMIDRELLKTWWQSLEFYGENLGPCFLQLPPHFDYSKKAVLFSFLQSWPQEFRLSLEFRHPSWFTPDRQVLPALGAYLRSKHIGLVMTDVAGRRDILTGSITSPFVLLRFIGNNLDPSDFRRSKVWAQRFADFQGKSLPQVYYFVHEPDDIKAPDMADQVIQDLNEACSLDIPQLKWMTPAQDDQLSLGD